jgi:maltose O-acetyltransferase
MFADCGKNVNIESGADFCSGRRISIGDNSGLGVDSLIMGPVAIGANVMMGPRVMLLATNHNTSRTDIPMILQGMREDRLIVIEDDVFIGAGAIILAGRRVGKGAIVGAGAVVAIDVLPYTTVVGNPAVAVRARNIRLG